MAIIRINESGWHKFSGNMGGIEFIDGVSVEDVSRNEMQRISAAVRIQEVISQDESGDVDGKQLGVTADLSRGMGTSAIVKQKETIVEDAVEEELEVAEVVAVDEDGEEYTREVLELIADKEGIIGLRKIAEKFGVKGNSIVRIIDGILDLTSEDTD